MRALALAMVVAGATGCLAPWDPCFGADCASYGGIVVRLPFEAAWNGTRVAEGFRALGFQDVVGDDEHAAADRPGDPRMRWDATRSGGAPGAPAWWLQAWVEAGPHALEPDATIQARAAQDWALHGPAVQRLFVAFEDATGWHASANPTWQATKAVA